MPANNFETGYSSDLILIAPTDAECRDWDALVAGIQTAVGILAGDGLVYVLAPRRYRRSIAAVLESSSLSITLSVLHYPDWASSRYLVPLRSGVLQYAFSSLVPTTLTRRLFARFAASSALGEKFLGMLLPWTGMVARRGGACPIGNWMFDPGNERETQRDLLISSSGAVKMGQ